MQSLTVIIAVRDELTNNLIETVRRLKPQLSEDDDIIIVSDSKKPVQLGEFDSVPVYYPLDTPRGCGACRDYGAKQVRTDLIMFIDGHVWLEDDVIPQAKKVLERSPKAVVCSHMQSMGRDWKDIDGFYAGASIVTCDDDGRQYTGVSARWAKDDIKSGQISACMGACYTMGTDFYVNGMGSPMSILQQWGGDEELLSICAWLCGGRVYLIEAVSHHMYGAPHTRPPAGDDEISRIWANRIAMLHALPIGEEERAEMLTWIRKTTFSANVKLLTNKYVNDKADEIAELKEHLSSQRRTWAGFSKKWVIPKNKCRKKAGYEELSKIDSSRYEPEKSMPAFRVVDVVEVQSATPTEESAKPQNVYRSVERCDLCDTINPWIKKGGNRLIGSVYLSYSKCKRCGHKAHIVYR